MTTQRLNIHFLTVLFNETSDYFTSYDYNFYSLSHANFSIRRHFHNEIPHFNKSDMDEIFSHGHTARVPLVYILRDLLNKHKKPLQKDWKEDWEEDWKVEIKDNGSLLLSNGSQEYSFHALNLGLYDLYDEVSTYEEIQEKIDEEYKGYCEDKNVNGHFVAVLDNFLLLQTVKFYKLVTV